jgi:hypothetical protein
MSGCWVRKELAFPRSLFDFELARRCQPTGFLLFLDTSASVGFGRSKAIDKMDKSKGDAALNGLQ